MLLIYTHKVTPRLTFIFKQIFTRILDIKIEFTSRVEEFIAHDGMKFSYSKQALGNEMFIKSNDLLFDQGIDYLDISLGKWDDDLCFFPSGGNSAIPFDIFAASFYLVSRYEEYLPQVKDEFERFPAKESLAYRYKFLDKPIVDIWAYKFRSILLKKFPNHRELIFNNKRFKFISTVDVDVAFFYKHKGLVRTVGGLFNDLFAFKLNDIWLRFLVIFNLKRDPNNTFNRLIYLQKKHKIRTIFFFLMGEYTTHDKNVSAGNLNYKLLIKNVADYCKVGIHPSYFSLRNDQLMKKEKKRLEQIVNFPITKSRQHYLRLDIPETYQNLVDLEIKEDYTMGYASHYGFRAGTCTPFYFYDLDYEIQTPLKIFPFAAMDGTFKDYLNFTAKRSFDTFMKLAEEVKKVDGTFITLFHNDSVGGTGRWKGWKELYENMMRELSN